MFNKFTPPPSPRKSCSLRNNVGKYGTAWQATDHNTIQLLRFARWIAKATNAHSDFVTLTALSW